MGIERVLLLAKENPYKDNKKIFFIVECEEYLVQALKLAQEIRDNFSKYQVIVNFTFQSFKTQFKKANSVDAFLALILGKQEFYDREISIKFLKEDCVQEKISQEQIVSYLSLHFAK